MSRQSKSGLIKSTSKWKAYTYSLGIFVLSFMTAFLAASVFNTPNNTNAEEGDNTSSASASGYNLSVSATTSVNLNLSVSDSDTMTISEGYVSVITNSPGYRLYISMTGDNTSLTGVKDGLSSAIAATSGTIAAPTSLTRGTWGYAIPSGTAHLVSNSFSDSYSTTTSTTPDSSKLFAVPPVASSNPALLASSTSATSGDTYPVFYAVQANSDTAPGNYTNNIAFTAVADAGSVDKVTVTPSSSNVNASVTMSVDTTLYTTEGFAEANVYLLTATEYNSISGTNVEALGKTPLSCNRTNLAPLSYSCTFTAPSTQDRYYVYVKAPKYNKVYTTTFNTNNPVTLTVNPNGGTWSGSTSTQNFTQNEGTTKTIANPTTGPSYTISYNANGQGATYSGSPTSVQRPFTSWSTSGSGTISGTTYTFGSANGTLTANYNTTSNSFTLPAITKTGYTCKWAEGSTSGTQYAGGTSRTITGNMTYFAVCSVNNYTVNITNSNTTSDAASLSIPYGGSRTVTVTPSSGYYLSAVTCPSGYTCTGYSTGSTRTGTQTVTVTNNNTAAGGTLKFTGALTLAKTCSNASVGSTFTYSSVDYIKLNTASSSTSGVDGSACYTKISQGTATWDNDNAASLCPASTGLPTQAEFQSLIDAYGSDGTIYNTTGWSGWYWSSTQLSVNNAYILVVTSSRARFYIEGTGNSWKVVCIVR